MIKRAARIHKTWTVLASLSALGILAVPAGADLAIAPSSTTAGKLTTLQVQVNITPNSAGVFVPASGVTVTIPKGMVLNTAALPASCLPDMLLNSGPSGCKAVGVLDSSGVFSATIGTGENAEDASETVTTQAFVTSKTKSSVQLGFLVHGQSPMAIEEVVTGTLTNGQLALRGLPDVSNLGLDLETAPYSLTFNVGAIKTLKVKANKNTRKVVTSLITAPKCPARRTLSWSATATYKDGTTSSATAQTTCR
jgi:hypothetical protein